MNRYAPEGSYIARPENRETLATAEGLTRALERGDILEAVAKLCDGDMCLHFDLGAMPAVMPRREVQYQRDGSEPKDIAVLTRVGKPVCFKVIGFTRREDGAAVAVVSRRAAQEECYSHFIDALRAGDLLPARVTHLESFGAFVDIGCGIVSLLSIDAISVSRIAHPSDRFSVGERILCLVRRIDDEGRVYVTHRELLGTWEENAADFSPGDTVAGIVRSIEGYGIFVELTPNLAGLAEYKAGVRVGDTAAVYIKSILPDKMKIKLIIIDSYKAEPERRLKYYVDPATEHIDRWRYSPESCARVVESVFEDS